LASQKNDKRDSIPVCAQRPPKRGSTEISKKEPQPEKGKSFIPTTTKSRGQQQTD